MPRTWIIKFFRATALLLIVLGPLLAPVKPAFAATPLTLIVYPYLNSTTSTSVVIAWATDQKGTGMARYSLDESYDNSVTATRFYRDGKHWYSAALTGLTENTTYFYKIFQDDSDLTPWETITLTTSPGSVVTDFTFAVLGDSQTGNTTVRPNPQAFALADQIDRANPDFVLRTGDMIYDGGPCQYTGSVWNQYVRNYFAVYRDFLGDTPVFTAIGNHEIKTEGCGYQGYTDVFYLPENAPAPDQEKYYSFDWGNAHFISLNVQQMYTIGSAQYAWLANDLATTTQPWKIVIFHQPVYSSGKHGETSNLQAHLVPLFEAYGVNLVFNGHDHDYERTCPIHRGACTTPQFGSVVYYVTGGGGAWTSSVGSSWFTAYSQKEDEFVKASVGVCRLQLDAISKTGVVFDSYLLDRCGASTTFTSQGNRDGWVLESATTHNKGGSISPAATTFRLGDDALNRQFKSILSFDTSSLPDEATVTSALLRIRKYGNAAGTNPFYLLGDLLVDIRRGAFGKATLAAGDFQASASAKKVGAFNNKPRNGWYSAILTGSGQNIINKTGITQFRLYFAQDDNDNARADYMRFFSGDYATNQPELIIMYSMP